jgi:hypothetical protein
MHKLALPLLSLAMFIGCAEEKTAAAPAPAPAPSVQPKAPAPPPSPASPPPAVAQGSGAKVSVAELFAQKDALAGKPVSLSGKVVKFNANIMGSNWIHVQDGTGGEGTNDITITTKAVVAVGDTVAVTGLVTRKKDFGAGYKFDVIIENAQVDKQ